MRTNANWPRWDCLQDETIRYHGNQFSAISPLVAEPVEVKPLPSLAFFCGRFDASMLRQAQQPQAQRPLQQAPTTILSKKAFKNYK